MTGDALRHHWMVMTSDALRHRWMVMIGDALRHRWTVMTGDALRHRWIVMIFCKLPIVKPFCKCKGKVFYGQEISNIESTTTDSEVTYQLLEVMLLM